MLRQKKGDKLFIRKPLLVISLVLGSVLGYLIFGTAMRPQYPTEIFVPTSAVGTEEVTTVEAMSPPVTWSEDYPSIIDQNEPNEESSEATPLEDTSPAVETPEAVETPKAAETPETNSPARSHYVVVARLRDIEELLKKATFEPYHVDGRATGLKITGLENVESATRLCLKNGDVILSINGHEVTDTEKAFHVFMEARSQAAMRVELQSNKEMKTVFFSFK